MFARTLTRLLVAGGLLLRAGDASAEPPCSAPDSPPEAVPESDSTAWCATELETLPGEVCHYSPPGEAREPRTLVIYLHGVIKADTTWQWTQERAMVRQARTHGLTALVPRGRRGIGPKGMEDWWTWPTSVRAQAQVEDEVIAEWLEAKRLLEARQGAPFERTYVFGFSNGAYYASALAMRGKLDVDGYAVFAGGGGTWLKRHGSATKVRPRIYVGYGKRDRAGSRDGYRFGAMLRTLGWPYKMIGRRNVGHTMADSQVAEALTFLGQR